MAQFHIQLSCFYRAASYAQCTAVLAIVKPSVRPSNACIVTTWKHLAKQRSILNNRKSTTSFPMSLRWTAYVNPKLPFWGRKNTKWPFLYEKTGYSRRNSATQFLCVKTFSGKVVRHPPAYLSIHKFSEGDAPIYLKFLTKLTHPLKNADFESIFARSASTVTPGEKKFKVQGQRVKSQGHSVVWRICTKIIIFHELIAWLSLNFVQTILEHRATRASCWRS